MPTIFKAFFMSCASYIYLNDKDQLDAVKAFITLALFNNIRLTFHILGPAFSTLIQVKNHLKLLK
jgi:hypothetical protein